MAVIHRDKWNNRGLGDVIDKVTTATGIKNIVKKIVGEDCGCNERKARLNNPNLMVNKILNSNKK